MNATFRSLLLIPLMLLISSAAHTDESPAAAEKPVATSKGQALLERVQAALPGLYSNFAQLQESAAGGPVTDLTIRGLNHTGDESVFLFASQQRDAIDSEYDIYWLKLNAEADQPELHFARLSGSELSLSLEATLALAWKRVRPGCVMPLESVEQRLVAKTRPDNCRFDNPLRGETRLFRSLAISDAGLETDSVELEPGEQSASGGASLILQKHRTYEGQASERPLTDPEAGEYGEWQSSIPFNTRDDGRIEKLYDGNMKTLSFAVQLARLHWRDGEPPYLKLSIIDTRSGAIQAYKWFKGDSEQIDLNHEWIRVVLKTGQADRPDL